MRNEDTGSPFAEILPLTPLQSGLFFEHLLAGDSSDVYVVQLVLSVHGPLDPARLRGAATQLLSRHDNLGAAFLHQGLSQPVQAIPKIIDLPWRELDLSQTPPGAQADVLHRLAGEESGQGFDIRRSPAMRFLVVRWSPARHSVVFTFHHILLDGWSIGLFFRELFELYDADGAERTLPPAVPYRRLFSWLSGRDKQAAQDAWSGELSGVSPLIVAPALAAGQVSQDGADYGHGEIQFTLSSAASARLAQMSRSRKLTMSTVFLGLWGIVLGTFAGSTDVVFGTTIAGRSPQIEGVESAVGLYANTVPVRVRWSADDRVSQVLSTVQSRQLRLSEHDWLGLAEIHQLVGKRSLFDTIAVFANYPDAAELGTARSRDLEVHGAVPTVRTHYALDVVAIPGEQWQIRVQFVPAAIDPATAQTLGAHLVRLLEAVAADPQVRVGQLEALGEADRDLVLEQWNDTGVRVEPASLAGLVERQVAASPGAVAA